MRRWLGLVIVAALAAGPLEAQGLGEAAAKEKRRREEAQKKNKGPARVVTTEDLAKVESATATEPPRPVSAQELGGKPRSASADEIDQDQPREKPVNPEAEARERGGQDEKTWRSQAADLRQEIQAAEQKLTALEEQVNKLFGDIQRSTDTYEIMRLRAEQDKLGEQIKIAKQELVNLRQELAQFEESARRAGVPPGWIR